MASSEFMAAADSPGKASLVSGSGKLLCSNTEPVLPIFLLSLIPCSLMLLSSSGPINPLILESLTMPYPTNTYVADFFLPGFDPRSYGTRALATVTTCHLLFFLPIVAGIGVVSLIRAGQQTSPRESAVAIAKSLSTASFLTRLCVTVLDLASTLLAKALIELPLGEFKFLSVIYAVPLLFRFFLRVLSFLALVVSAVEGRCGVSALRRAVEIVGRRSLQVCCCFRWSMVLAFTVSSNCPWSVATSMAGRGRSCGPRCRSFEWQAGRRWAYGRSRRTSCSIGRPRRRSAERTRAPWSTKEERTEERASAALCSVIAIVHDRADEQAQA